MKLPTLDQLQAELAGALARSIQASAGGQLGESQVREAAASIVRGEGLTGDAAAFFGEDKPVCTLVCFDANRIHRWVFDSERVQVADGASQTLAEINRAVRTSWRDVEGVEGTLFSAGGGGILVAGANASTEELVRRTRDWLEGPQWLRGTRHGLTFSILAERLVASDLRQGQAPRALPQGSDFGLGRFEWVDGVQGALVRTQIKMRLAKESRPRFDDSALLDRAPRAGARVERCRSCGRRPPNGTPRDDSPRYWCDWCQALREKARALRPGAFERKNGEPLTFADLAECVDRTRQYLGFVALDGNDMGSVVQGMRGFLHLRAFSEATEAIFKAARREAREIVARYLRKDWDPEDGCLPLLSGGDEITLVLPAAAAPEAAAALLRAVERGFDEQCRPPGLLHEAFRGDSRLLERLGKIGAAAGVVTAHANYPVRLLRRYADELQKHAKFSCATEKGYRSAVAWRLLTDSSPLTRRLEREPSPEMALPAFERLLEEAAAAREVQVPSSAFQGVLSQYRHEAGALDSLVGQAKEEVLGLVTANHFRYQLARNERLRAWWQRLGFEAVADSDGDRGGDAVSRWFAERGGRRLEKLVELLTLDPFPQNATTARGEAHEEA